MNNEPVAWMFQGAFDTSTYVSFEKPNLDIYPNPTPLFTHPAKYCPSENNAAYEKGFIDGMAKMTESAVHRAVEGMSEKTLTDEEILDEYRQCYGDEGTLTDCYFARQILLRAQEK